MTDNNLDPVKLIISGKNVWADTLRTIKALEIPLDESWSVFFTGARNNILRAAEFEQMLEQDPGFSSFSLEHLQKLNHGYFAEVLPGADGYDVCPANPDCATAKFGLQTGQLVSALYAHMRNYLSWVRLGNYRQLSGCNNLYLSLHDLWKKGNLCFDSARSLFAAHMADQLELATLFGLYQANDPEFALYRHILESADFSDLRYLYRFGIYVKPEILKMAGFIAAYAEADLRSIAKNHVAAFLSSFVRKNRDYRQKKYARVIYPMGMEKLGLMIVQELAEKGLAAAVSAPDTSGANEQYSYDLRYNSSLYFDEQYAGRRVTAYENALARMQDKICLQAGPLVVLLFGQKPFVPVIKNTILTMSEEQDKIQHATQGKLTAMYYKTAPREEASFSMIAFPSSEIGENFAAIFQDTLKINTLDNMHYARIQQQMIDILDQAEYVHVKGVKGNETDFRIQLHQIKNPAKETLFENCVADVNIPVGEIFTSPKLTGTDGILHVSDIYLGNLRYFNLKLTFKDGMVNDYSCSNFADEAENRKYVFDNLLKPNKTLPLGEFAIGTNTLAYRMAEKYDIKHLLPILITEKMGPHFAIGDTCYAHEEDSPHLSLLSKKLIIATENEKSCLRKTDPSNAYTYKHTDITLPYDMLAEISAVKADGTRISIIANGKFAVAGTEELNEPLER